MSCTNVERTVNDFPQIVLFLSEEPLVLNESILGCCFRIKRLTTSVDLSGKTLFLRLALSVDRYSTHALSYFRAPIEQRSKNLIAELTLTSHGEALFFQLQRNMLLLSAKDLIKALIFILDKL